MSGLTYVAELPIPALVPSVYLSMGVPAVSLNANLTGALSVSASFSASPPSVAQYLAALQVLESQLALGISFGVPSASFSVSDTVTLVADLQAAFQLLVNLELLFQVPIGMYSFLYSGPAVALGPAITSNIAVAWPDGTPSFGPCFALVFGAVSPIAQSSIAAFLNGLQTGSGLVYTDKLKALSALSPLTANATVQGNAGITASLKAALSMQASVSASIPTLVTTAAALSRFADNLKALLNLPPPNVSVAISATANLAASISAQFGLMAALGAVLRYDALLFVYTYSGPGNTLPSGPGLGWDVGTALATTWGDGVTPTALPCTAAVLATLSSSDFATMLAFFGGAV